MVLQHDVATGTLGLDDAAVTSFAASLRGALVRRTDAGYDAARTIWNGMIDKRPALIVRCAGVSDVIAAVNFARTNNLVVAVRGGGHNVSGNAVCDDGLMIDLSGMTAVRVDPARRTARAEPGVLWRDFDRETHVFGLATTGGVVSATGVAGLTLGGGVGWLVRKYGMACDNLVSVDIVTADGQVRTASADENADLFWGVRGGGGNFGIVTSFEFRLHPVAQVLGGMIVHPFSAARDVLRFYRDFVLTAPEELTLYAAMLTLPDGTPVIALVGCYCGPIETGEQVVRPLREFGSPILDALQPMPYPQMQQLLDAGFPAGLQSYWKSNFLAGLPDEAIDVLVDAAAAVSSPLTSTVVEFYGGAASRVAEQDTAFPHRQAMFDLVIISLWPDKSDADRHINWTRETFEAMRPFSSGRVYVNALSAGEGRVKEAFGANYARLVELKNRYDPTNFFRLNQNVPPIA
jgi:FAD/FMN-containing dehydrogenase